MTVERQREDDIQTVGIVLEWRPLCIVPQHELNALTSHLRDECGWGAVRISEAVTGYVTCPRVILDLMVLGCPPKVKHEGERG